MVPGLNPDKEYRVYLIDPAKQCGATAMLSAKAAQPIEIHLAACGSATVRLVDDAGQPYANYNIEERPYISVDLIQEPGSNATFYESKEPTFEGYYVVNADPERYEALRTDSDGRITFPTLIPGADYRLLALNQAQERQRDEGFHRPAWADAGTGGIQGKTVT